MHLHILAIREHASKLVKVEKKSLDGHIVKVSITSLGVEYELVRLCKCEVGRS